MSFFYDGIKEDYNDVIKAQNKHVFNFLPKVYETWREQFRQILPILIISDEMVYYIYQIKMKKKIFLTCIKKTVQVMMQRLMLMKLDLMCLYNIFISGKMHSYHHSRTNEYYFYFNYTQLYYAL